MPSYAFDGRTKLGHMALQCLVEQERSLKALLTRIPTIRQRFSILHDALYAVEGSVCVREISDNFTNELLFASNASLGEHEEFSNEMRVAMRTAIPKLNDIREKLYASNPG